MCSDCEEGIFLCNWCGDECCGTCDDPDTCRSCWNPNPDPDPEVLDDEDICNREECIEEECDCNCHGDEIKEILADMRDDPPEEPFVRKGTYNFLDIPGEIRMKIYRYAFSQRGEQRQTAAHRGTIHTALLKTCRIVYSEARHLPLTLNRLCFPGPLEALYFLGFRLAPTVRNMFTGLDIEFHLFAYATPAFICLLQELAKTSITHLGLTVKGGYPADVLMGHTCFVNHLRPIKSLTSLDLTLASFQVTRKQNLEIQEEMRTQLIEGHGPKKQPKKVGKSSAKKRNAPMEEDVKGRKPGKRPKKSQTGVRIDVQTNVPRHRLTFSPRNSQIRSSRSVSYKAEKSTQRHLQKLSSRPSRKCLLHMANFRHTPPNLTQKQSQSKSGLNRLDKQPAKETRRISRHWLSLSGTHWRNNTSRWPRLAHSSQLSYSIALSQASNYRHL